MKKIIAMLLAVVMILALGACGAKSEPEKAEAPAEASKPAAAEKTDKPAEPVTISWAMNETAVLTRDKYEAIVAAFEEDHPEIKIDLKLVAGYGLDQYRTDVAGNTIPDIFVNAAGIAVVEDALAAMPDWLADKFRPDYLQQTFGAYRLVPSVSQGVWAVIYNREMFANAGITDFPTTWDEYCGICDKLVASGVTPLALWGSTDQAFMANVWTGAVLSNEIFSADPDFNAHLKTGEAKWTDAYIKNSFENLKALGTSGYLHEGYKSLSYADALAEFYAGNTAMVIDGVWGLTGQDFNKYGVFILPDDAGSNMSTMTKMYWGVNENAENLDACWTFIDWALCGDGQQLYTDMILASDAQISCAKEAVSYEMDPMVAAFYELLESREAIVEPIAVIGEDALPGGMTNPYFNAITEVFFNGVDIDTALETLQSEYETLLAEQG